MGNKVSIFFNVEKAFDNTQKYSIMNDLYDIRGDLPYFIQYFSSEKKLQSISNKDSHSVGAMGKHWGRGT